MSMTKKQNADFNELADLILGSPEQFIYADEKSIAVFEKEGLVEVNRSMTDANGAVAVRLTDASQGSNPQAEGSNAQAEGGTKAPKSTTSNEFAIDDNVPVPAVSHSGGGRSAKYPFDQLQAGQSFFVGNSEKMPDAAKSLASTVTTANKRYAEADPSGATRVNRRGNEVPVEIFTRRFVVRGVTENGVEGARVWRTE